MANDREDLNACVVDSEGGWDNKDTEPRKMKRTLSLTPGKAKATTEQGREAEGEDGFVSAGGVNVRTGARAGGKRATYRVL